MYQGQLTKKDVRSKASYLQDFQNVHTSVSIGVTTQKNNGFQLMLRTHQLSQTQLCMILSVGS